MQPGGERSRIWTNKGEDIRTCRITSATDADNMWLTGAKFSGSGETFFIVLYVKNTAAVNVKRQELECEKRIIQDLPRARCL